MQNMHWKILIIVVALALAVFPLTQHGVRLGKDLAGGLSLIYHINIDDSLNDNEAKAIVKQVIEVLNDRVNPQGVLDITIIAQGRDRIEIVMPLPSQKTKEAKQDFREHLTKILREAHINPNDLQQELAEHTAVETWGGEDGTEQHQRLSDLQETFDRQRILLAQYNEAIANGADQVSRDAIEVELAEVSVAFEDLEREVLRLSLGEAEIRRMLDLATEPRETRDDEGKLVRDEEGQPKLSPSQREIELGNMKIRFKHVADDLDALVEAHLNWQKQLRGFDDVEDLKRLLRGAGVLDFRIAATTGGGPEKGYNADQLRRDLAENGPDHVSSPTVRWFRINDLRQWYDDEEDLARLTANPVGYFATGRGLEAAEFGGEYYLLLYDTPEKKLTHERGMGAWTLTSARSQTDQLGRPAVEFNLDAPGGIKMRKLTGRNLQAPMAIVLDGEVFSAPIIRGPIGKSGEITGSFSKTDIQYLIRVLASGSLDVRLDDEPIAQNILGPAMGRDNLVRGLGAFVLGLILVGAFMIAYYFFAGAVADVALLINAVLIFGIMAMQQAAFTLPGIAGIVLTIGMAVDANVLIYERIREEIFAGETDLRTAIRLGYEKALSTIVDANVTNLIVCVVLYNYATTEVKGFALTLGIGILATLFTALFVTRVIYTLYTDLFKVQKLPMLPTVIPAVHRALEPKINWIGLRKIFIPISVVLVVLGLVLAFSRGEEMLDTELRGGVSATFVTRLVDEAEKAEDKRVSADGRLLLERAEVERRVQAIGERAKADDDPSNDNLDGFLNANVVAVGGSQEGSRSDSFQVKVAARTRDASETDQIIAALVEEFRKDRTITNTPPHVFRDEEAELPPPGATNVVAEGHSFLAQVINRSGHNQGVAEYRGGLAILIDDLDPPARIDDVTDRIARMRQQPKYRAAAGRPFEVVGLEQSSDRGGYTSIAVLVVDERYTYLDDPGLWQTWMAELEWNLVRESLREPAQLEQVATYSASVAETLAAKAVVAMILSLLGILVYIWIRFGSFRYSLAAIVALVHDVSIALGLLALTHLIAGTAIGDFLRIDDFRIDLGVVAALLTIIGYSLNDTIVILDRVRENRGKLPLASAETINLSINQTISRTVLTSTTTLLAVMTMYIAGGMGIRPFAFCLLIGVIVGTYSSVAIAAPLVYQKTDSDARGSVDMVNDEAVDGPATETG